MPQKDHPYLVYLLTLLSSTFLAHPSFLNLSCSLFIPQPFLLTLLCSIFLAYQHRLFLLNLSYSPRAFGSPFILTFSCSPLLSHLSLPTFSHAHLFFPTSPCLPFPMLTSSFPPLLAYLFPCSPLLSHLSLPTFSHAHLFFPTSPCLPFPMLTSSYTYPFLYSPLFCSALCSHLLVLNCSCSPFLFTFSYRYLSFLAHPYYPPCSPLHSCFHVNN